MKSIELRFVLHADSKLDAALIGYLNNFKSGKGFQQRNQQIKGLMFAGLQSVLNGKEDPALNVLSNSFLSDEKVSEQTEKLTISQETLRKNETVSEVIFEVITEKIGEVKNPISSIDKFSEYEGKKINAVALIDSFSSVSDKKEAETAGLNTVEIRIENAKKRLAALKSLE